jgi:hypothetical protein
LTQNLTFGLSAGGHGKDEIVLARACRGELAIRATITSHRMAPPIARDARQGRAQQLFTADTAALRRDASAVPFTLPPPTSKSALRATRCRRPLT